MQFTEVGLPYTKVTPSYFDTKTLRPKYLVRVTGEQQSKCEPVYTN